MDTSWNFTLLETFQSDNNASGYTAGCVCNSHGLCTNPITGTCVCDLGYGGSDQYSRVTCQESWLTVYPKTFIAYRVICILFTTIAMLYAILNSVYYWRVVNNFQDALKSEMLRKYTLMRATVSRTAKVILGTLSIWLIFDWIVWTFDPMNYYDTLPYGVYRYFTDSGIVMANIYTLALLEHVVKFTHYSLASLNKNELVKKVNSTYNKEVTIEQMIDENSKNNTIFWVSVCIGGTLTIIQLFVTIFHSLHNASAVVLEFIFDIYALVLFACYAASIYFVWKRYIAVIPGEIFPLAFISKVFRKAAGSIVANSSSILLTIIVTSSYGTWDGAYYYQPILIILKYTAVFCALSIFNPPRFKDYLLILGDSQLVKWELAHLFLPNVSQRPDTDELDSIDFLEFKRERAAKAAIELATGSTETLEPKTQDILVIESDFE